jgi:hypothetical protein
MSGVTTFRMRTPATREETREAGRSFCDREPAVTQPADPGSALDDDHHISRPAFEKEEDF